MESLKTQIGGNHYKDMAIQPAEYILANKLEWAEGSIVGYISRWREKGGVQDLQKIQHLCSMLIENEHREPD